MTAVPPVHFIAPPEHAPEPEPEKDSPTVAFDGLTDVQIEAVRFTADATGRDPGELAVELFPLLYISPRYGEGASSAASTAASV